MTLVRLILLLGLGLVAGSSALASETPVTATVLGSALQSRDPQELQYLIIQPLLDRYADSQGITVSAEELATYQAAKQRFMEEDRRRREMRRAELAARRKAEAFADKQREALSRELEVLEQLAAAEKDEASDADDPEIKTYAEEVARSFILRWKVNRALYRQYGGRIIFQQAGPEPFDAYRKFLEEHAEKGNFRIFDAGMEQEFWRYFTNDAMHQFYPPGSAEEARAFDLVLPVSDR